MSGPWIRYGGATAVCGAATVLFLPMAERFDRSNIVALFILTVVVIALRLGRGPAAYAAVLCVCAFDYVFVPPRFSFDVNDLQYLLTFFIMLGVGLITGQLTAGLRLQADVAAQREERARALYEIASELSATLEVGQVARVSHAAIARLFNAEAALILPDVHGQVTRVLPAGGAYAPNLDAAQWAFAQRQAAGAGTGALSARSALYLPLAAADNARGVIAIEPRPARLQDDDLRQLLDTLTALIAVALERLHYEAVAQDAVVAMESERLRNSLLAALSHDLRTPLTVVTGLAESLSLMQPSLTPPQRQAVQAIHDEAQRMTALVKNLLDMARIESGDVALQLQWHSLEEIVGTALDATRRLLAGREIIVRLAPDLPLLRIDAVLIERVLVNLLENVAKYTPPGTVVTLSAGAAGHWVTVTVADTGPGLPAGREAAVFQKFARGDAESATPGVGLGLAICRAIVEAHGGQICGANAAAGGAVLSFTLPYSQQPVDQGGVDV